MLFGGMIILYWVSFARLCKDDSRGTKVVIGYDHLYVQEPEALIAQAIRDLQAVRVPSGRKG